MKKLLIVAVLLITLAGCTTTYVQTNNEQQTAFAQTKYNCEQQSRVSGAFGAAGSQRFVAGAVGIMAIAVVAQQRHNFKACMAAAGYTAQ